MPAQVWRPEDTAKPSPDTPGSGIFRPDIQDAIEKSINDLDKDLRSLSLDIHGKYTSIISNSSQGLLDHPELGFEERYAHDALTAFMAKQGFEVSKNYLLETAWLATFTHGNGGRTIGLNSEMDALAGIGHACGHNLIAIASVAVACALKSALQQFNIAGTIRLLGTPAEEGGCGKVLLLEQGAYKGMDICLMSHPAPGPKGSVSLTSALAVQRLEVEYFGHTAHAALSPWEGTNALDAAVLGYNNISALRQQLKPTVRVHGIFEGKDWAPNIIPDYAKFICLVRAPTTVEQHAALERVKPCFEAAALASGCKVKITTSHGMDDLRQNKALGEEVARIVYSRYGSIDYEWGIHSASTDFGNVTYEIPGLHPGFAIPTVPDGGNHTRDFAKAAKTIEAHNACLDVSKALTGCAIRVLLDDGFFEEVKRTFQEDKIAREQGI